MLQIETKFPARVQLSCADTRKFEISSESRSLTYSNHTSLLICPVVTPRYSISNLLNTGRKRLTFDRVSGPVIMCYLTRFPSQRTLNQATSSSSTTVLLPSCIASRFKRWHPKVKATRSARRLDPRFVCKTEIVRWPDLRTCNGC